MATKSLKLQVLYEDNHLIIVNKPPKIPVQGDRTGDLSLIDIAKNCGADFVTYKEAEMHEATCVSRGMGGPPGGMGGPPPMQSAPM